MPDRPSFPVPEDLTPDTYCLCIQMPNDPTWKTVIAGLLWQPAEWFNWQRDDAKSGTVLAHYWREIFAQIDWSTMSCCCDDIPLSRFTSEGVYQTSNDGGVTWVDNPGADPRNISPQLPPIVSTGNPVDDRCRSATNVVSAMTSAVDEFGGELGTVGSILALALAIVSAIVGVFAVPPSATVLIPIVIALAQAIYSIASGTYLALFTPSVYNDLQCILYCNCPSDGTFTDQNYRDILTAIDGHGFDVNVALTFTSVISGWGLHGLNDAARGGSTATGDCTDCGCNDICGNDWSAGFNYGGVLLHSDTFMSDGIDIDGNYYMIVHSFDRGDGTQSAGITMPVGVCNSSCCVSWVFLTGSGTSHIAASTQSGTCPAYENLTFNSLLPNPSNCNSLYFEEGGTSYYEMKFTFEASPCPS